MELGHGRWSGWVVCTLGVSGQLRCVSGVFVFERFRKTAGIGLGWGGQRRCRDRQSRLLVVLLCDARIEEIEVAG